MSITDELRDWAKEHLSRNSILAIADRIDAEHEKAEQDLIDANNQMEQLCECSIRLPVDADGVPVRVGDVMEWPTTGETFEVVSIGDGTLFYIEDGNELADWTGASTKRHHHEPTVEDVLREFALAVCKDDVLTIRKDVVDEYAAKLQLREDA